MEQLRKKKEVGLPPKVPQEVTSPARKHDDLVPSETSQVQPKAGSSHIPVPKKRTRGKTVNKNLQKLQLGQCIQVEIDEGGHAIGNQQFSSRLGAIVRAIVPPTFASWKDIPEEYHSQIIRELECTYEWGVEQLTIVRILRHAGGLYRNWVHHLYKTNIKDKSPSDYLSSPPEDISLENWKQFCSLKASKEFTDLSMQNITNRSKGPAATHNTGRTTLSTMRRDIEVKTGKPADRVTTFEYSKNKIGPDGTRIWLDPLYEKRYGQMMALLEGQDETPENREASYRKVMPPEHGGFVRGVGTGVTITQWYGRSSSVSKAEYESLRSEVQTLRKEGQELRKEGQEVREMLANMQNLLMQLVQPPQHPRNTTQNLRDDGSNDPGQGVA